MEHRQSSRRPIELLLIEDNPADVRLIREALKDATVPYRLTIAYDGEQALNLLCRSYGVVNACRPDFVLLDLNLPKVDGLEVLKAIKRDPRLRRTPVVVLTSSSAQSDVDQAYDLGANAYLRKPQDVVEVFGLIKTVEHYWMDCAVLPTA